MHQRITSDNRAGADRTGKTAPYLQGDTMKKGKQNVVVGVFYTRSEAEQAIRDLRTAGFSEDRIGMVARDAEGHVVTEKGGETLAEETAATGPLVGSGARALVALSLLTATIPLITPMIAIG